MNVSKLERGGLKYFGDFAIISNSASKPAWKTTVRNYVSGPTCLQVSCSTGSGANSARQQYTNVSSSKSPHYMKEVKEAFMRKNAHKAKIKKDNPATAERDKN